MKLFLKNLFLFSSLLTIPILILEVSIAKCKLYALSEKKLDKVYTRNFSSYRWVNNLRSNNKKLLLGSSSVRYGLSCSILNNLTKNEANFINLGMDTRGPIETYFLLKNIDLTNVTNIYLGLDPWIYCKNYYKYKSGYLFLDFNFIESIKFYFEHDKSIFKKRYSSFFYYLFPFNRKKEQNFQVPDDFGSISLQRSAINFTPPTKDNFQIEKYGWSNLQFKYLKKISLLCKKNNIPFSVFIPPKRIDYIKYYKKFNKKNHTEYLKQVTNSIQNTPVFGRFDQLQDSDEILCFAEAYHLNLKGQQKYSKIFYDLSKNVKDVFSIHYPWY